MKDYSAMSDFEINREVGSCIGITWDILDENYSRLSYWKGHNLCVFEPCNSWADAGPLIQDNGLTVACYKKQKSDAWQSSVGIIDGIIIEHENPLRAAMIVFLMMKEAA